MNRAEFRDRKQILISVERDMYKEFQLLCDRERKSTSLKFKEMIGEELEKNALGPANPANIQYSIYQYTESNQPTVHIPLDRFIDINDVNRLTEKINKENQNIAYANSRKIFLRACHITKGKIPDV